MNMPLQSLPPLNSRKLSINAIGLNTRGIETLRLFVKKFCVDRYKIGADDQADIFILNMDSVDAEKKLQELEARDSTTPIILMAVNHIETEKHYFIEKPVNTEKLLAILTNIEQQLKMNTKDTLVSVPESEADKKEMPIVATTSVAQKMSQAEIAHFIGHRGDIDLIDSKQLEAIYFDPKRYYLGHVIEALELAKQQNASIQIIGMSHTLYLCPNQNLVYVELSDNKLRYYGVTALYSAGITDEKRDRFSYKLIADEDVVALSEISPKYQQELCAFLWKLSLWTARGRLPKGISLDTPVRLKVWPNFTRLVPLPYALRISAYWIAGPKTLRSMAKSLFIEQRYLFSFFTASYMTRRSDVVPNDNDHVTMKTKENNSKQSDKNRGFFSRLIRKLTSS